MSLDETERLRRWRLLLGRPADACLQVELDGAMAERDRVLEALYDTSRHGSLGASAPDVVRWLGDIRSYFPASVVQVMQKDALDRLGLERMLLEPELLASVAPDVHLVASLLSLSRVIPQRTRETARRVVRQVVQEIERRLAQVTVQAVRGAVHRAARARRPRPADIDWERTVRANLSRYDAARRTVVVERLLGRGRRQPSMRDLVLCVDQSGSMASSVVYASVFAAALATVRAVCTRLVVFDTSVVDLSDLLADPVEVLFGTQLGGGTDINRALAYCQGLVTRPSSTVLVLITDLFEGGDAPEMLGRAKALVDAGVTVVCLLALNDKGAPSYDAKHAAAFATLGIPTFACTPDVFPDLLAAAIRRRDLGAWAGQQGIVTATGAGPVPG